MPIGQRKPRLFSVRHMVRLSYHALEDGSTASTYTFAWLKGPCWQKLAEWAPEDDTPVVEALRPRPGLAAAAWYPGWLPIVLALPISRQLCGQPLNPSARVAVVLLILVSDTVLSTRSFGMWIRCVRFGASGARAASTRTPTLRVEGEERAAGS